MTDLWVARDADGWLTIFYEQPKIMNGAWFEPDRPTRYIAIENARFPELKPGECRRLILAEDKSE